MNMSGDVREAGHHLTAGLDHHEEARVGLERIGDLVSRAANVRGDAAVLPSRGPAKATPRRFWRFWRWGRPHV
jgi:hypothetical protein